MAAVVLGMPRLAALDLNPETEPPHRELAEPVQRVGGRERDAVVGPNHVRESKFLEGALEDRKREFFLGRQQGLARQQVAAGEVGDRQGIAVLAIAEQKFALVVGTPERVRFASGGERRPGRAAAPPAAMVHQAIAIEHGVDRADGGQLRSRELLPELLADLRRAPAGILPLQADDRGFNRRRQPIRLPVRPVAPIAEGLDPAIFVTVVDLVAGLARNPELGAQRRHLLALEQAGDKPESLVHDVTLLPRHAPSSWGQSVTHPLGIRCYLTLRKDTQ